MDTYISQHSSAHILRSRFRSLSTGLLLAAFGVALLSPAAGCRDLQKRRVELKTASGANPELDDRFGLTADAQDPSERDKELGYGRWKQKPETEGTASPTDPSRRQPIGSP